MLSLDEKPLLLAGAFIVGAPKPGCGAVYLWWGYSQGHQKDLVLGAAWFGSPSLSCGNGIDWWMAQDIYSSAHQRVRMRSRSSQNCWASAIGSSSHRF